MAEVIRMPLLSDTMKEGVIVAWHKKEGDKVKSGDILADVETDKATMELENYEEGVLLHIGVKEGDSVPVDAVIAIVGEKGEDYKELLEKEKSAGKEDKSGEEEEESKSEAKEEKSDDKSEDKADSKKKEAEEEKKEETPDKGRVKASPLAKKIAKEHNIALSKVKGTGDNNRVVRRDVEDYLESGAKEVPAGAEEAYKDVSVSQMRKTIASRLAESKFTAPHFYLNSEINMDAVIRGREILNEKSEKKISVNDIIIKASALALKKHPQVNASWLGDKIRYYHHVHIGVAVAVEEGLLVPVVRFADTKGMMQINEEVKAYAEKARDKKLQPSDWEGNTFTISNLGMFGIESFTAIINPPDSCILAVGGVKDVPVVKDGNLSSTKVMKVTLSCDHRVVDGVTGAKFLQTLRELLEEPLRMLV